MRTATVRDLRNNYLKLLQWVEAGEEILISRRGKNVARIVPDIDGGKRSVDWKKSAAIRDRSKEPCLSAEASRAIRHESGGKW